MIKKLLIANRGEIACRIIRTCRKLGIKTVAIYSSVDERALHRELADESIHIGEPETSHSYLNIPKILAASKKTHADALHPGYGFLAENAPFVDELSKHKILFIGPSSDSMRLVGDKINAKELALRNSVPTVPGTVVGPSQGSRSAGAAGKLGKFAAEVGYPILVKAAGGGGGRGMRKVYKEEQLAEALKSAAREAKSFFGDERVYVEKLIENARHVEVQIIGDKHGDVRHLFDRDCSFQRNHQKIIEEAPAPGIQDSLRRQIQDSAVKLCKAAGYFNAGTVEFLLAPDGKFYFLEVNSRLQVEHPVSEAITGLDLVELQLRVAQGEALRDLLRAEFLNAENGGHAIECRICAEAPEELFAPSTGRIHAFEIPSNLSSTCTIRIDTGYRQQDSVTHYYDSLIAKVICHAPSRAQAIAGMRRCLSETRLFGVRSNIGFLTALVSAVEFSTIRHHTTLAQKLVPSTESLRQEADLAAALATIAPLINANNNAFEPWSESSGWRLHGTAKTRARYVAGARQISVNVELGSQLKVRFDDGSKTNGDHEIVAPSLIFSELRSNGCGFNFVLNGVEQSCESVELTDGEVWIKTSNSILTLRRVRGSLRDLADQVGFHSEDISSPLPGKILDVRISNGAEVNEGDPLVVIESMKMEHVLRAPKAGKVKRVMVNTGQVVESNTVLAQLEYA